MREKLAKSEALSSERQKTIAVLEDMSTRLHQERASLLHANGRLQAEIAELRKVAETCLADAARFEKQKDEAIAALRGIREALDGYGQNAINDMFGDDDNWIEAECEMDRILKDEPLAS